MFGIDLGSLPWGTIGMVAGAVALYLFGYKNARNKDKRLQQKAKLDAEKALRKAERKMRTIREDSRKKVKELDDVLKKAKESGDMHMFCDCANRLLREVFKADSDDS